MGQIFSQHSQSEAILHAFVFFLETAQKIKKTLSLHCFLLCRFLLSPSFCEKKVSQLKKEKNEKRQLCWLIHVPLGTLLCLNRIFLLGLSGWLIENISVSRKSVLTLNSPKIRIFSKGIYSIFVQLDRSARDETQRCFEARKDQGGNSFRDDGDRHAKSWKDWHPSSPLFQPSADISFSSVQEHPLSLFWFMALDWSVVPLFIAGLLPHLVSAMTKFGWGDSCWYKILIFFLNSSGSQDCMNNAVRRASVMCLSA